MKTFGERLQDDVRLMRMEDEEQKAFAIEQAGKLPEATAKAIYEKAGTEDEVFIAIFTESAKASKVALPPKPRAALRELVRTAALEERERGECYRKLGICTEREIEELFPKLARVYESEEDAAHELRGVLLGRVL